MTKPPTTSEPEPATKSPPADATRTLVQSYRPYFAHRLPALAIMSGASFASGAVESVLLVIVANVALTVGGQAGAGEGITANLGPIDALDLSVEQSLLLALLLGAVRMACQLLSASIAGRMSADLIAEVRSGTFRDYAAASWAEQSRRREADVQDLLIRHVSRVSGGISTIARAISTAFLVLALLLSAVAVDPMSAVLLVVSGAGLFAVIRPITTKAKSLSSAQLIAGRDYAARSLQALTISQEIRAFGVSDEVIAAYTAISGYTPTDMDWYLMYAATRLVIVFTRTSRRAAHFGDAPMPDNPDDAIMHAPTLEAMMAGTYWSDLAARQK